MTRIIKRDEFHQPANEFLRQFFEAQGAHPNPREAYDYFTKALVFANEERFIHLVEELRPPASDQVKVVILDGHPRSGKTFLATAALAKLVDEYELGSEDWWTPGVDCMGIYRDGRSTLYDGAMRVYEELEKRRPPKLILLDDFLGTNALRPIGRDQEAVKSFFNWTTEGQQESQSDSASWLEELRGCTLLITARSVFLALTEILLGIHIRPRPSVRVEQSGIIVKNYRSGIFRSLDGRLLFGAHGKESLKLVYDQSMKYHPFKDDSKWLYRESPILYFAIREQQIKKMSDDELEIVASTLFGDDLAAIADEIEKLNIQMQFKNPVGRFKNYLSGRQSTLRHRLDEAYLFSIAPGLVYIGPTAYEALGISKEVIDFLVNDFYFKESVDCLTPRGSTILRSGRLPNEIYAIALQRHLANYLPVAQTVFARHTMRKINNITETDESIGIGLRGIVESAVKHGKSIGAKDSHALNSGEWDRLLNAYISNQEDNLLYWETYKKIGFKTELPAKRMNPGFAASLGWAVYYFGFKSKVINKLACSKIVEWFLQEFNKSWSVLEGTNQAYNTVYKIDREMMIAVYSTLLQWAIRSWMEDHESNFLSMVFSSGKESNGEFNQELEVVITDEIMWASTLDQDILRPSKPAAELRVIPEVCDLKNRIKAESSSQLACSDSRRVNQFFSLAWHNEWRMNTADEYHKIATDWLMVHAEASLKLLKDRPELLDKNLTYHWYHFITQHAVWMRNWCFEPDPFEFENRRIAAGSSEPAHNEHLQEIAWLILKEDCEPTRFRNMFLLISSRAERMPQPQFQKLLDNVKRILQDNHCLRIAFLQSIFELSRQEYWESRSRIPEYERLREEFRAWCQSCFNDCVMLVEEAWGPYFEKLTHVTYLDPLPSRPEHVIPKDWY